MGMLPQLLERAFRGVFLPFLNFPLAFSRFPPAFSPPFSLPFLPLFLCLFSPFPPAFSPLFPAFSPPSPPPFSLAFSSLFFPAFSPFPPVFSPLFPSPCSPLSRSTQRCLVQAQIPAWNLGCCWKRSHLDPITNQFPALLRAFPSLQGLWSPPQKFPVATELLITHHRANEPLPAHSCSQLLQKPR